MYADDTNVLFNGSAKTALQMQANDYLVKISKCLAKSPL